MSVSVVAGKTWVVKIGSSLLTNNGAGIDHALVQTWINDIVALRRTGIRIVIVSSGAVVEGMKRLGLSERPRSVHKLQAAAAVGQMGLIQIYESAFFRHGLHTAQILLTHDDLRSRQRYLNARGTLKELLDMGVIPIINENDTVVTDEIQFGDNDTLAALVANLIEAHTLLLLTDQVGLFTSNPVNDATATLVTEMEASSSELDRMAGEGSSLGRGGMITKVRAARIAARSGANTVIASGRSPGVLRALAQGEVSGTLLTSGCEPLVAKKQWLATLSVKGQLQLDAGASRVLRQEGRSLLPVGVISTAGNYTRGDMVACFDENRREVAKGLINYSSDETKRLCGVTSVAIESVLGFVSEDELIHRDNLVLSE